MQFHWISFTRLKWTEPITEDGLHNQIPFPAFLRSLVSELLTLLLWFDLVVELLNHALLWDWIMTRILTFAPRLRHLFHSSSMKCWTWTVINHLIDDDYYCRFAWPCRQDITRFAVTQKIRTTAGCLMIYVAFHLVYWPFTSPAFITPSGVTT